MKRYTRSIPALVFMAVMFFHIPSYAVKHIVLVGNYFFNPSSLNVSVGDTVRWQWSAGSHTTTSGVIPSGAASWDHQINSGSQVFDYPVTVAGTFNYVCTPHAAMGMIGTFTATGFVPTLAVSPSNRNVTATSGSTTFSVTSNSAWNSSSNASWCTVGAGGNGNGTITATYSANPNVTQRTATITVTVSGLPDQTVTVTQAGAAPTLTVAPASQSVPATAGTTSFTVTSNTTWTAVSNASWCQAAPASGSGNGTLTATYAANTTHAIRIATLTITVTGLTPQTVTVSQAASTVGIAGTESLQEIQVFPNPSNGQFKLNVGSYCEHTATINILDINGKCILSRNCSGAREYSFDLSGEVKGTYFVHITMAGQEVVKRLVLVN
ncbi:MAG: BACON domain-containing carbohydrate-binding protein [Bacteroidota bacterium]